MSIKINRKKFLDTDFRLRYDEGRLTGRFCGCKLKKGAKLWETQRNSRFW